MSLGTNAWLMISGGALFVLGYLLWRWSSRYNLKDVAIDSAWHVVRGRRSSANPTPIEMKVAEIGAEGSVVGKSRRAAETVVGHFVAQLVGLIAIVLLLLGVVLAAVGFFWK